ncbi:MAG TPA: protein kinase, partial [Hyalangium sp.]|nr:protein kinase [Hyalangium sp.]
MTQKEANALVRPLPGHEVTRPPNTPEEKPQAAGAPFVFTPSPPSTSTARPPALRSRTSAGTERSSVREGTASGLESGPVPEPGTRIHQYELIRQIGSGGMGTVFLARDTRLGRRVAIKFLHASSAEVTQRFIREAQTTARCSHENIVIIYEVGEF